MDDLHNIELSTPCILGVKKLFDHLTVTDLENFDLTPLEQDALAELFHAVVGEIEELQIDNKL